MSVIASINIASPSQVVYHGSKAMFSGIFKKPVHTKVFLTIAGFEGDGCADSRHHGGPDKAVCVYSQDHYPYWERELSKKLQSGAFGENLTVANLDEKTAHIGDIFQIGDAKVQITQPRQPCHKLNKIHDCREISAWILSAGFTGFYLRVLEPGWVEPGNALNIVEYGEKRIAIETANRCMYQDKQNVQKIREIMALDSLSKSWKDAFKEHLKKMGALY